MAGQALQAPASLLTQEEAAFVYNIEVLDMPPKLAARLANMPYGSYSRPHIVQAREQMRREIRGNLQVTRDDITFGLKEAITHARLLGEPMTMIVGYEKLAKLHGLNEPEKHILNINASVEVLQKTVRALTTADLVGMLGAGGIIDAEFYPVEDHPVEPSNDKE